MMVILPASIMYVKLFSFMLFPLEDQSIIFMILQGR